MSKISRPVGTIEITGKNASHGQCLRRSNKNTISIKVLKKNIENFYNGTTFNMMNVIGEVNEGEVFQSSLRDEKFSIRYFAGPKGPAYHQ